MKNNFAAFMHCYPQYEETIKPGDFMVMKIGGNFCAAMFLRPLDDEIFIIDEYKNHKQTLMTHFLAHHIIKVCRLDMVN